jgi:hypothetical protein
MSSLRHQQHGIAVADIGVMVVAVVVGVADIVAVAVAVTRDHCHLVVSDIAVADAAATHIAFALTFTTRTKG